MNGCRDIRRLLPWPRSAQGSSGGAGRSEEEKGTDLWGAEKVRSAGLEGVQLGAGAFTGEGVLGKSGRLVQLDTVSLRCFRDILEGWDGGCKDRCGALVR